MKTFLLAIVCMGMMGCDWRNDYILREQKHLRSHEPVLFIQKVREHPIYNREDTLAIINSEMNWFMYDTISYREEFKYEPLSQTTYTVIKNMGSFTFTSNDTVYVDILKFSGLNYTRNVHLRPSPVVIIGEPDSLFLRFWYEMYETL